MAATSNAPEKADAPSITAFGKWESMKEDQTVKDTADNYATFFDRSKGEAGISERRANYTTVVNSYYDLVTDFYEYVFISSPATPSLPIPSRQFLTILIHSQGTAGVSVSISPPVLLDSRSMILSSHTKSGLPTRLKSALASVSWCVLCDKNEYMINSVLRE